MTTEIIKSPFYILFVDDEENARKYFDKGLKHEFNILTAASVDEAIKIIDENTIDYMGCTFKKEGATKSKSGKEKTE